MKISFTHDEVCLIVLAHVKSMGWQADKVEFQGTYGRHREDFCVVEKEKLEQVPNHETEQA
jgi:hypothetical protein